uniref:G-protein coupled receptors family 1 profile domain-containing protein n=2 Tax=Clytia hemisphaerica TaxID=252671 RepID=A0A7M6DJL0_9CNID
MGHHNNSLNTDTSNLTHFVVMTIQPSIGTLLTLVAILVIIRQKRLLRRISNKFLVNLFMANCFASFSMVGYAALALFHIHNHEHRANLQLTHVLMDEEVIFYIIVVTSMILSLINRMAVTLDRLLAIKKPFFYKEKFTTKVFFIIVGVTLAIALTYFIALLVCYLYLPMKTVMLALQISFVSVIMSGFLVLNTVNYIIYREARRQLRAIAGVSGNKNRKKQLLRREYRLVCICIGIVLSFELCWSPCLIWFMHDLLGKQVAGNFQFVACHLICLNNILDPLIYGWLSKDVKRDLKRFFLGRLKKKRNFGAEIDCSDASVTINFSTYYNSNHEVNRYSTAF